LMKSVSTTFRALTFGIWLMMDYRAKLHSNIRYRVPERTLANEEMPPLLTLLSGFIFSCIAFTVAHRSHTSRHLVALTLWFLCICDAAFHVLVCPEPDNTFEVCFSLLFTVQRSCAICLLTRFQWSYLPISSRSHFTSRGWRLQISTILGLPA
jgi:hypothetical protein